MHQNEERVSNLKKVEQLEKKCHLYQQENEQLRNDNEQLKNEGRQVIHTIQI